MISANVFDIKRFGVNDGLGIRTVLFIKGCPLRCRWCQNPEGLHPGIRLWYLRNVCVQCKSCIAACEKDCISWDAQGAKIDHEVCDRCGECVSACPAGALRMDSERMSAEEAMAEIERDALFYKLSGGGVTLSGGECTASPEFSLSILRECKKRGIHTAIETCLYAPEELIEEFAAVTDQIVADIKLLDPVRHKAATGVDNALILKNVRLLAERKAKLLLRTPLIPGFTDDDDNIRAIARFVASVDKGIPLQLLNYNPMCKEKYRSLREDYPIPPEIKPLSKERIMALEDIIISCGLRVVKEGNDSE